jgi:hypothetical protein
MKANVKTALALQQAAHQSAKGTVLEVAKKNPGLLANRLAQSPALANGLADFDYIVYELLAAGQREHIHRMLDSRSLNAKARLVIVTALLTT